MSRDLDVQIFIKLIDKSTMDNFCFNEMSYVINNRIGKGVLYGNKRM